MSTYPALPILKDVLWNIQIIGPFIRGTCSYKWICGLFAPCVSRKHLLCKHGLSSHKLMLRADASSREPRTKLDARWESCVENKSTAKQNLEKTLLHVPRKCILNKVERKENKF